MVGRTLLFALAIGSRAFIAEAQAASPTPVTLEYRWVGDGAARAVHRAVDAMSGQVVMVSDSVALALGGVARAQVVAPGRGMSDWDVIVRLTPHATQAFAAETGAHVGRQLAVLVDGRVVQIATVTSRLGRVAGVVAGVPRAAADSLAARINGAVAPAQH